MKKRRRLKDIEASIKVACGTPDDEFTCRYMASAWSAIWEHPHSRKAYALTLTQSSKTSEAELEACFSLVEETSRKDYETSSRGWSPKAKKKEMREPDLRYILVKDPDDGTVCGFVSLMPTVEDGEPVLYCYEIHLKPVLRSTGLASFLMSLLETAATKIEGIDKVMLTVFTCNQQALSFYRRCGFEADETSPQPRKLRNGLVKHPDYAIMSKIIDRPYDSSIAVDKAKRFKDGPPESSISWPAEVAKIDQSTTNQIDTTVTQDFSKDTLDR